jgi:hypothetical protein
MTRTGNIAPSMSGVSSNQIKSHDNSNFSRLMSLEYQENTIKTTSLIKPKHGDLEGFPKISKVLLNADFPARRLSFDPATVSNDPLPASGSRAGVAGEIDAAMRDLGLQPDGKHDDLRRYFVAMAYAESTWNMARVGDTGRGEDRASRGALQFALLVQGDTGRAVRDNQGKIIPRGQLKAENSPANARRALRASISHFCNLFNNPYDGGKKHDIRSTLLSYQVGHGSRMRDDTQEYWKRIESRL